jgi:hypothetical protein
VRDWGAIWGVWPPLQADPCPAPAAPWEDLGVWRPQATSVWWVGGESIGGWRFRPGRGGPSSTSPRERQHNHRTMSGIPQPKQDHPFASVAPAWPGAVLSTIRSAWGVLQRAGGLPGHPIHALPRAPFALGLPPRETDVEIGFGRGEMKPLTERPILFAGPAPNNPDSKAGKPRRPDRQGNDGNLSSPPAMPKCEPPVTPEADESVILRPAGDRLRCYGRPSPMPRSVVPRIWHPAPQARLGGSESGEGGRQGKSRVGPLQQVAVPLNIYVGAQGICRQASSASLWWRPSLDPL